MRKLTTLLTAATVAAFALTGCDKAQPDIVTDEGNVVIDVGPGLRWDIRMASELILADDLSRAESRCDTYGGVFVQHPDGSFWCESVDY